MAETREIPPKGFVPIYPIGTVCKCPFVWRDEGEQYWCCNGIPRLEADKRRAATAFRWDRHFLDLALTHAKMSKDPSTKVGAVIVGPDRELIGAGFNGFPRGIADTPERLGDRETKLKLVVHGEMNAILAAARRGHAIKDCTMYVSATDASGAVWGGPPCVRCTVETIQAGIAEIVSWPIKTAPSRWHADLEEARKLLAEAGIRYREVTFQEAA